MPQAIVRKPTQSYSYAIDDWYRREKGSRERKIDIAREQHGRYVAALAHAGARIWELPDDDRFPDGCFTQDPVLVWEDSILELNAKMPSRQGEAEAFVTHFSAQGYTLDRVDEGYCDGGDVMIAPDLKRVWVGLSTRTDERGFHKVKNFYETRGFRVEGIRVTDCLHLITGASYIGEGNFLISDAIDMRESLVQNGYSIIYVPPEEAYAVNVVSIGRTVIMPEGYPQTQAAIEEKGYGVLAIPMSEFAKADGSATCLSNLFF